jgi:hypothetical protein
MIRIVVITSLLVGFLGVVARADLVYFAKGGSAQLPATIDGDVVRLLTPEGPRSFARSDFAAILPEIDLQREWTTRRQAAKADARVEARFAAAWWALENGLTEEALAAMTALRDLTSPGTPAARAVAAIDRLKAPCPDGDFRPVLDRLGPRRFRETRSAHFVLLHQVGEPEAKERLDLVERVASTFSVAFAAQGIEFPAPHSRLVTVVFADRRDYLAALRRDDGDAFAGTQGYYHPILRAVLTYDGRTGPEQQSGRRALANLRVGGESGSNLARQSLLLDLDWRATDLGILAHETVHQLSEAVGLAPRFDDFPTWLHEGLAAQFEVVRGGQWAGFGRLHDLRLPDWRSIHPSPRLAPLLRDQGFGHGYRRDAYAGSWALVYFLRKTRPREFLAFLDRLRTPRTEGDLQPDRNIEAFFASFGRDLPRLEAEWHRYLDGLKTPLDAGRPTGPDSSLHSPLPATERPLVEPQPAH